MKGGTNARGRPFRILQLVLPNPQDAPALLSKSPRDSAVSGSVSSYLLAPVGCVGLWLFAMLRAAVPEAAVNEYYQPLALEKEVRATRELGMPSPSLDRVAAQNLDQTQFSRAVPFRPHRSHHLRSFPRAEYV